MNGLAFCASTVSRHITSDARALPPGELTLNTIALIPQSENLKSGSVDYFEILRTGILPIYFLIRFCSAPYRHLGFQADYYKWQFLFRNRKSGFHFFVYQ